MTLFQIPFFGYLGLGFSAFNPSAIERLDLGYRYRNTNKISILLSGPGVSLTNVRVGIVCVRFSGRLGWDRWWQQTETGSTTPISQSLSSGTISKFSAALTCRGRRWGRSGRGWGESCGRLLLFTFLFTLGLFGGAGVLWFFVLLLVLLFLFFLVRRSPYPAQKPWSQDSNSHWEIVFQNMLVGIDQLLVTLAHLLMRGMFSLCEMCSKTSSSNSSE